MKSGFLDKLVERLDRLDPGSVQTQFLHLAKEKGLLETIFQAIQEGILVLDGQGRVAYANQAAQKMLGFDADTAHRQPISRYLRGVDWDLVLNFDEAEWSRLIRRELEITYPEHRFIEFYVVPLSMVSVDESGVVMLFRDVTRNREVAADTLESEKLNAIMLLAAGVAHEIGNPLNSLHIHMQLLDRELKHLPDESRENLAELVAVARNEIGRLDQIINQFLRAVRPAQPQLRPQHIAALLEESLAVVKQELEDRGIWVELEVAESIPPVQLDKAQMKQVIFNLVKNAFQSMGAGGLLKIKVACTEKFVTLAFKDNGKGIKPEDLTHIFEPYHTTKSDGTGLGLMIVQRIVRDHGGFIEIDTQPDQGSTFTLFLPREDVRIRLLEAPGGTRRHNPLPSTEPPA